MGKEIYIDIGHGKSISGRYDPGAVSPRTGARENDIAMNVGKRLGHLLRAKGFKTSGVALAADKDNESLVEAVHNANAADCDLFVSIHCNSFHSDRANGFEVLYTSAHGREAATAVVMEVAYQIQGGESKWLSYPLRIKNRGAKRRTDLYVLNETIMPAILVELLFISNEQDEWALHDRYIRQALAQAVADGISKYFGEKERGI